MSCEKVPKARFRLDLVVWMAFHMQLNFISNNKLHLSPSEYTSHMRDHALCLDGIYYNTQDN